ncbi:MAG: 16S rRNA (uracil(1498)-N(3))-methyltransferase [Planctomycetota bacterium]
MARRYYQNPLPEPGAATLRGELVRHLAAVRLRVGDRICLFDGAGRECAARIVAIARQTVAIEAEPVAERIGRCAVALELAVALPKGNRAEWLFEHATEIGVDRFRPILTERTRDRGGRDRLDRWRRIVIAAAEQCDRSHLPQVDAETSLEALLADPSLPTERRVAAPSGVVELTGSATNRVVVCIGPEGGFTDGELAALAQAHFLPVRLGVLTLRTETAALVAAARVLMGARESR